MAIRSLVFSVLALALLSTPSLACMTLDQFVSKIRPADPIIMLSRSEATKRIIATVNKNRESVGAKPLDASVFLVAGFPQEDGSIIIGVVLFDANGCAIEETAVILSQKQWSDFAASAGLTEDDLAVLNES